MAEPLRLLYKQYSHQLRQSLSFAISIPTAGEACSLPSSCQTEGYGWYGTTACFVPHRGHALRTKSTSLDVERLY